ncbi:hypothetical protein DSO57_1034086 [Entomophthora muscae]|uniref:Uncharacterized protein n=1 Tax=Entomophthora muscae TaxID=34485 RepID=A0ACC2RQS2_9FUNG|nr:hypothetical protein DSO57_1034086 [Entomophthora muscae]
MKEQKPNIKELELEIRSCILSVAQESKSKEKESKTKYKESKILLKGSKYWQTHIVSLTSWVIYQKVSNGILLLRKHFPLLENDNLFQPVPGYDPGHTLGTDGQELHSLALFLGEFLITSSSSSRSKEKPMHPGQGSLEQL